MDGNWNTALIVGLDTRTVERVQIPDDWYAAYIGGEGTGARLFADLVDFDKEPLDPSQPLIFSVGPLTATAARGRSPLP